MHMHIILILISRDIERMSEVNEEKSSFLKKKLAMPACKL